MQGKTISAIDLSEAFGLARPMDGQRIQST
jgi:hypothetical protein